MVFGDPVGGVGDGEVAHADGIRPVVVQRLAPLGGMPVGEVVPAEGLEEVPVRSDVVVDHVEDHAEAEGMGAVDEGPQVVRPAVEMRRGEEVDAVVAPAEAAGEFVDRHHVDHGDAEVLEEGQPVGRRRPAALRREGADMHLVEHLARHGDAPPGAVGPGEGLRVDDLRGSHGPLGLGTRRRVGIEGRVGADAVAIAGPGRDPGQQDGVVAVGLPRQGVFAPALQHQCHAVVVGSPDAKRYAPLEDLRAHGKASLCWPCRHAWGSSPAPGTGTRGTTARSAGGSAPRRPPHAVPRQASAGGSPDTSS